MSPAVYLLGAICAILVILFFSFSHAPEKEYAILLDCQGRTKNVMPLADYQFLLDEYPKDYIFNK